MQVQPISFSTASPPTVDAFILARMQIKLHSSFADLATLLEDYSFLVSIGEE